jgi:ParB/RepB/Spo0J family partition protein
MSTSDTIQQLPLSALRECPTNPRRTYTDLDDLAASIRHQGVLSPLLVRPLPGDQTDIEHLYELVFGHRRLRAARLAGLEFVPCQVRDMTDEQAALAQVAENLQRADVTPLEEADGFARLRRDHGMSADDIAEAVHKSRSYVFGRLKLAASSPGLRVAMEEDGLPADIALEVARVRSDVGQMAVLRDLRRNRAPATASDSGWPPVRAARMMVRAAMTLRIGTAPWSEDDARFGEACSKCPKLARNDPDLAEAFDPDVCTDRTCYSHRLSMWTDTREVELTELGIKVLSGDQAMKHVAYRSPHDMTLRGLQQLPAFMDRAVPGGAFEGVPVLDAIDQVRAAGYVIPVPDALRLEGPDQIFLVLPRTDWYELQQAWQQLLARERCEEVDDDAPTGRAERAAKAGDDDADDDTTGDLFDGGERSPGVSASRVDDRSTWTEDERAAVDANIAHALKLTVLTAAWAQPERTRGELLLLLRREIELAGELPDTVSRLSGLARRWEAMDDEVREDTHKGEWLLAQIDDMTGAELARILVCTAIDDELDGVNDRRYFNPTRRSAARRVDIAQAYGVSPAAIAERARTDPAPSESDDTTEALHG